MNWLSILQVRDSKECSCFVLIFCLPQSALEIQTSLFHHCPDVNSQITLYVLLLAAIPNPNSFSLNPFLDPLESPDQWLANYLFVTLGPQLPLLYLLASPSYVLKTPSLFLAPLLLTITVENLQNYILDYLSFHLCVLPVAYHPFTWLHLLSTANNFQVSIFNLYLFSRDSYSQLLFEYFHLDNAHWKLNPYPTLKVYYKIKLTRFKFSNVKY